MNSSPRKSLILCMVFVSFTAQTATAGMRLALTKAPRRLFPKRLYSTLQQRGSSPLKRSLPSTISTRYIHATRYAPYKSSVDTLADAVLVPMGLFGLIGLGTVVYGVGEHYWAKNLSRPHELKKVFRKTKESEWVLVEDESGPFWMKSINLSHPHIELWKFAPLIKAAFDSLDPEQVKDIVYTQTGYNVLFKIRDDKSIEPSKTYPDFINQLWERTNALLTDFAENWELKPAAYTGEDRTEILKISQNGKTPVTAVRKMRHFSSPEALKSPSDWNSIFNSLAQPCIKDGISIGYNGQSSYNYFTANKIRVLGSTESVGTFLECLKAQYLTSRAVQ